MIGPPPRSTSFPYTTLFRSLERVGLGERAAPADDPRVRDERQPDPRRPRRAAAAGIGLSFIPYARIVCGCSALARSEEHTSELQSRLHLVCRLLLEKKKTQL